MYCEDCDTCCELGDEGKDECPKAIRACGHHCNCIWYHDACCWCGAEIDDDGNLGLPNPENEMKCLLAKHQDAKEVPK